ncbi:tyrosine protein phosphatase 1 [Teratosphaeriaceae sp. CCFEE 6253]|nr:tyrosine protein phosphatase 1 [Teratosphaeriaceae sp. CCFEE 6253]
MEFEMEIKHPSWAQNALIVTKWLDLGPCETPAEPKLRRYLPGNFSSAPKTARKAGKESRVRLCFEQDCRTPQAMLTDANAHMLRDGLYRRKFKRYPVGNMWTRSNEG